MAASGGWGRARLTLMGATACGSGGGVMLVTADHGNADFMVNDDGTPNTAHTTNLVPCLLVDDGYKGKMKDGKLGDIAPTILTLMGIPIPKEMTGQVLIEK